MTQMRSAAASLALTISALAGLACADGSSGARPAEAPHSAEAAAAPEVAATSDASHFVIAGDESARAEPKVSVHLDPGEGEGLFSDGVTRYEVRMLPDPLGEDDLTVWILNLREDSPPGRLEVTDRLDTPSVVIGVGRGLIKGYNRVLSGHLEIEELDESLTLSLEAELESQAALDRARRGQRITVRGRVVGVRIPRE
ncbi:MAG: hypothetical protein AAF725_16290 [Acidobacteriota bacterium]